MIRGAIFDADGTIFDSMGIWMNAGAMYLEGLGKVPKPDIGEVMFPMSMQEGAVYLIEEYDLTQDIREVSDGINSVVEKFYREEVSEKPEVRKLLNGLKEAGIPMVIATSSDRYLIEAGLRKTGLLHYFREIFTCTEVGAGKSCPDIFIEASRYISARPEEIYVFEDGLYAAWTAKKCGFHVAGIYDPSGRSWREEYKSMADWYFDSYETTDEFFHFIGESCDIIQG